MVVAVVAKDRDAAADVVVAGVPVVAVVVVVAAVAVGAVAHKRPASLRDAVSGLLLGP